MCFYVCVNSIVFLITVFFIQFESFFSPFVVEKASKPADLDKKIVFCPSAKRKTAEVSSTTSSNSSSNEKVKQVSVKEGPLPQQPPSKKDTPKNRDQSKSKLSFDADEEEEF